MEKEKAEQDNEFFLHCRLIISIINLMTLGFSALNVAKRMHSFCPLLFHTLRFPVLSNTILSNLSSNILPILLSWMTIPVLMKTTSKRSFEVTCMFGRNVLFLKTFPFSLLTDLFSNASLFFTGSLCRLNALQISYFSKPHNLTRHHVWPALYYPYLI